jgi:hypothetical protein
MAALALEAEEAADVSALSRVRRGRMAVAASVTLAALPVLVLDNLPATAETYDDGRAAVATIVEESSSTVGEIPTTTAAAPTTTLAPPTTVASTDAPPSTVAPAPAASEPIAPPTTQPPPPPTPAAMTGDPNDPQTWERLAQCESGGNWAMNAGNGYYGGLQFSLATWRSVGGAGYPHQASKAEQIRRGKILQAQAGWAQWPGCSRALGYL